MPSVAAIVRRSLAGAAPPVLLLAVLGAAPACSSGKRPVVASRDLQDPAANVRAKAVQDVVKRKDTTQVPALIELLDDPDPGVRMMSGAALRDLTGRDTGYDASARPSVRREQVEQWRAWWQSEHPTSAPTGGVR